MGAKYGFASQFGLGNASAVSVRLDFLSEDIGLHEEMPYLGGLRGTRERDISRVRAGIRRCGGPCSFHPTAVELQSFLPWILGGNASSNTYALTETLQYESVWVDRGIKVPVYSNCLVNTARFHADQAGPLTLDLSIVGVDETLGNAGSFTSSSIDTTTLPFMFWEGVIGLNGNTYQAKNFSLELDSMVDGDRFFNSQTLSTAFQAKDRQVKANFQLPAGDAIALYGASGSTGFAGNIVFTTGNSVLTFVFGKVVIPRQPWGVRGREEIFLNMPAEIYHTGNTASLTTTLIPTP